MDHAWDSEGGGCEEDAEGGIRADEEVLSGAMLVFPIRNGVWQVKDILFCRHRSRIDL